MPTTPRDIALAQRLAVVRRFINDAIALVPGPRLRVLSLCAGDGWDVLPVLERWSNRKAISGRLIDVDATLTNRARATVERAGLDGIDVLTLLNLRITSVQCRPTS